MKTIKTELILITLTLIATIASSFLIDVPGTALAVSDWGSQDSMGVAGPKEYPKPHPTPQAPANFPWHRMPDGHIPPPFKTPSPYPGPTSYPGPTTP